MREVTRSEFLQMARSRRAEYSFAHGVHAGLDGSLWSIPLVAFSAAAAKRGEKLAAGTAAMASAATFPVIQGVVAAGLSLIPGIGPTSVVFLSMLGAAYPSSLVDNFVTRKIRTFTQFGKEARTLEFGQNFQDSEFAATRRYIAQAEMAATIQSTRRFLGQEAQILHR